MKQLHPKAFWLFFFQPLAFPVLFWIIWLLFFFGILIGGTSQGKSNIITILFSNFYLVPVIIIISIVLDYIWAKLAYNNYRYQFTEDAVKIEKGVIWKKYISIPYERIQNVDIHRGIIARILKLSDLQIQTAGYSGSPYAASTEGKLPGLDIQTAEQLREGLIKRVKGTKQGL